MEIYVKFLFSNSLTIMLHQGILDFKFNFITLRYSSGSVPLNLGFIEGIFYVSYTQNKK